MRQRGFNSGHHAFLGITPAACGDSRELPYLGVGTIGAHDEGGGQRATPVYICMAQSHLRAIMSDNDRRHAGGTQQGDVAEAAQPIQQCCLNDTVFYDMTEGACTDVSAVKMDFALICKGGRYSAARIPYMHFTKRTHAPRRHAGPGAHRREDPLRGLGNG